jgi:predicted nucleotidyltransferase
MQSLRELLLLLADSGIDFVVIGGFAGVVHGSSIVTRDLDICAVLTTENIAKLRAALKDLDPRHRMAPQRLSFLQVPKVGEPVNNLYLETDWGAVDILTSVSGVGDLERLKSRAETFEIDGRRCRMIALVDLIQAKESLGREKDLLAAKELRAIAARRSAGRT